MQKSTLALRLSVSLCLFSFGLCLSLILILILIPILDLLPSISRTRSTWPSANTIMRRTDHKTNRSPRLELSGER